MLSLTSPTTALPGVGPVLNKSLAKLHIHTVRDLLFHLPFRYEDFSNVVPLAELRVNEQVTVRGKLQLIKTRRAFRRRLNITEALVSDGTATVKAVWFNLPYLAKSLTPGTEVVLGGTLRVTNYGLQLEHPTIELAEKSGIHTGRLVPLYPLTSNVTHRQLRTLIHRALPLVAQVVDKLPPEVRTLAKLLALPEAIRQLHFPSSPQKLKVARERVVFDELFYLNLHATLARQALRKQRAPTIPFAQETKNLVASLPWLLTPDQKIAAWEIIQDLGKSEPMYRLLQGDVGSGKTVVAGIACFNASRAGYQSVLLAPTEILAEQHFHTLTALFKNWPITLALLTRGHHETVGGPAVATTSAIKRALAAGTISITVGTHAVLQRSVTFKNLGLVVVDEQHRFGVEQRHGLLSGSGTTPHFLSLTATPIPRSLALTVYGGLDLSVLQSLPKGRKPISTTIVPPPDRTRAYELMRREVKNGNRVFIICPLIEESDVLGVRAATAEYERLARDVFPRESLGLLHGKLPARAKTEVMNKFKSGKKPILISTSVVEVGVDVPEATVIAIESAERFGLAQLHHFRGRVGRSNRPSTCLLFTAASQNERSRARLEALVCFQSGFDVAEFDLKSRGPGDLLGQLQSGWGNLRFASLADTALLASVRRGVDRTLALDPSLKRWPELRALVEQKPAHPE